mgnify:CR=1 FL=1
MATTTPAGAGGGGGGVPAGGEDAGGEDRYCHVYDPRLEGEVSVGLDGVGGHGFQFLTYIAGFLYFPQTAMLLL